MKVRSSPQALDLSRETFLRRTLEQASEAST